MNILVTGGAGFIGSHLCEALAKRGGARIISLDDYSTGSTDNHVDGVEYRRGPTFDIGELVPERPDVVFHLGEYARVESSFRDHARLTSSNVSGTDEVVKYWLRQECKLIYAGSSTRFATDRAISPYAFSKRVNAMRIAELANDYKRSAAITYFFNVYGPRERPASEAGTLIETFRRQRLAGKPLTVVAPGTQRRNFTHVADIVSGLLLAMDHDGEYQIGAPESYSVLEVAEMFGGPIEMLPPREGNRASSTIDTTAIEGLGWKPRHRLADYIAAAVQETAAIHKEHA